jgi:phosphatidylinositol alpha-1,6-mannosyltransferase
MTKLLALVGDAFGGSGGIARYNRDLLGALAAAGTSIVVLPRDGRTDPALLPLRVRQEQPRGRAGYVLRALRIGLRDGPFDAVFCGHINLAPAAALLARLMRRPWWLQLHGTEAWQPLSALQRRTVEGASLVTAVSRLTRHRFNGLAQVPPWRLRVLPNTVGSRFATGPRPRHLLDRHSLHGRTVLLTVGRLAIDEQGKGHDRVIAALPALADTRPGIVYLIVGEGGDRARLEALAAAKGTTDRVIFAGAVPDDELPAYYRLADLFVMPSVQEGFGIVLLEAAASGLRVLAGKRDGSADALADGVLGRLIDPLDDGALVDAIDEMLAAPPPPTTAVEPYRAHFAEHAAALLDELLSPPRTAGAEQQQLNAVS